MTSSGRLRGVDARAWATATWLAPLTTQVILALVILTSWTFGKWFLGSAALLQFLVGAAVVLIVCAVIAIPLGRAGTPLAHGIAVSIAGGYAVVIVGGLLYGFWIMRW